MTYGSTTYLECFVFSLSLKLSSSSKPLLAGFKPLIAGSMPLSAGYEPVPVSSPVFAAGSEVLPLSFETVVVPYRAAALSASSDAL